MESQRFDLFPIQLKHEIPRKPVDITLGCLDQHPRLDLIKRGQIAAEVKTLLEALDSNNLPARNSGADADMAQLKLILQAATNNTHAAAIRNLFEPVDPENALISVGFVRETGVAAVEDSLRATAPKTTFFVGIRNDVTTIQGIKRLLTLKGKVYAVDTGSRDTLFHPKMYLARNKKQARVIVGSANMTFQGLHNNIEVSAIVTLDMSNKEDRRFVDETENLFTELVRQYPRHVFEIKDDKHAEELFESGRLSDERLVSAPSVLNRLQKGARDSLPRMMLNRIAQSRLAAPIGKTISKLASQLPQSVVATGAIAVATPAGAVIPAIVPQDEFYLVWESKPLQERDLNIPKGANTHVTGSMSLDKGLLEGVDHRHFFYDDVFQDVKWTPKRKQTHLLIAQADFEVIIKDINYGKHRLTLTHNTNTQSKSYKQRNAMTGLRWGTIKHLIKDHDLMDRTLSLYRKETNPPEFLIEID